MSALYLEIIQELIKTATLNSRNSTPCRFSCIKQNVIPIIGNALRGESSSLITFSVLRHVCDAGNKSVTVFFHEKKTNAKFNARNKIKMKPTATHLRQKHEAMFLSINNDIQSVWDPQVLSLYAATN